jgi:hypothetical protein
MPEEIRYYALVDEYSSRAEPGGVVRRVQKGGSLHDEAFSVDLVWKPTAVLYAAERGDTMNEFYEISEDEAMRIVERIRRDTAT